MLTANSTAYRLWSSRGDPIPGNPDPAAIPSTGEETSALAREAPPPSNTAKPAGTIGSPVSSKGTLSEEPPPPAYEESVLPTGATGTDTHADAGRVGEGDEWVDMDDVGGSSVPIAAPSIV